MLKTFSLFVIGAVGLFFGVRDVSALEIGSPVDKEAFAVQEEIRFIAETSLPDTVVTWDFGDQTATVKGHVVYHKYEEANWYTVTATSDDGGSESVTIAVVKVESVTIAKSSICAGGIDSDVHKSKVTVQLFPAVAYDELNIELRNGAGWQGGTVTRWVNPVGTVTYGGSPKPAQLTIGGETLTGSDSAQRVTIATDDSGKAEGDILSSNKIDDEATVYAAVGPEDASKGEDTVSFGSPDLTLILPAELTESFVLTVEVSFNGESVDRHKVLVVVSDVQRPQVTAKKIGDMKQVPKPEWTNYVKHMIFSAGLSNPARVTTGIYKPNDPSPHVLGYYGAKVEYTAYDDTAISQAGADALSQQ